MRCLFNFMSNGGGVGDSPAAALSSAEKASDTMGPFSLGVNGGQAAWC